MAPALTHPRPSEAITRLDDLGNGQVRLTIREEVAWSVALEILERLREAERDGGGADDCDVSSKPGNFTPRRR